jgi:hypothetical protein
MEPQPRPERETAKGGNGRQKKMYFALGEIKVVAQPFLSRA